MRIQGKSTLILGLICLFLLSPSTFAAFVEKAPDVGDYWYPLSNTGTYVYANSFVAPEDGTASDLGLWLNGGSPDVVFQIYGSIGDNPANGPDTTAVLATTAVQSGLSFSSLTYYESSVLGGSTPLTASNTYWFGASTVGLGGDSGYFNVGGHTQNSGGIVDNGTFWYSNDPAGINFDGQNNTPEMAFKVTYTPGVPNQIPLPSSCLLVVSGIVGIAGVRKKLS